MASPVNGAMVPVWPLHARVPVGESAGASFLPMAGRSVSWSRWWDQRLRDGDVTLSDPTPAPPKVVARPLNLNRPAE